MAGTITWEVVRGGLWCALSTVSSVLMVGLIRDSEQTHRTAARPMVSLDLDGLRYAVATDLKGDIRHSIDNKAAVQVFQDDEERGP